MFSQGPFYAGTVIDDASIGTLVWGTPANAQDVPDNAFAGITRPAANYSHTSVKTIKGGVIGGTDLSDGAVVPSLAGPPPLTWAQFGGPTQLWGQPWVAADINASNFGFAIAYLAGSSSPATTHYLNAQNFGFAIPSATSKILGILCEVDEDQETNTTSFPAGTLIKTPSGDFPIESIRQGQIVYGLKKGRVSTGHVSAIRSRIADTLTLYADHPVTATPNHRFYVGGGKWTRADRLKKGDSIYLFSRGQIVPSLIRSIKHNPLLRKVYSLSVPETRSYFADGYAVHNIIVGFTSTLYVDAMRITVYYFSSPPMLSMMGVGG